MFKPLSFNDAVFLFKEWGFHIEPGPLPEEITLIIETENCRIYTVFLAENLSEIAAFVLKVRWDNGLLASSFITDGWGQCVPCWSGAKLLNGTLLPPN